MMNKELSKLIDPNVPPQQKTDVCQDVLPYLGEVDGYFSFSSEEASELGSSGSNESTKTPTTTSGRLPVLEWNSHFRKAYSLVLWVRPVVGAEKETTVAEDDAAATSGGAFGPLSGHPGDTSTNKNKRILYRFATSVDDATSVGVCVTVGDWRAVVEEEEDEEQEQDNDNNASPRIQTEKKKKEKPRKLLTTLTAYTLPYTPPDINDPLGMMHMFMSDDNGQNGDSDTNAGYSPNPSAFVTAPIELMEGSWSMIGITHVFPYLKRPHWTVCVNGRVAASGELAYPVLEKTPVMNFNTLFQNIVHGGCQVLATSTSDVKKKASELQHQIHPRHQLRLHLATFMLSNEALTPTIQALLAQAGPTMTIQAGGSIPCLPPVANWSKGSSLDGVNVGIPLVVHGQALRVQQLSASCVLWGSATEARLMGTSLDSGRSPRIVCHMPVRRGKVDTAPRVGLVQPTPPQMYGASGSSHGVRNTNYDGTDESNGTVPLDGDSDSEPISMTIVGRSCSLHHNLTKYLLGRNSASEEEADMSSTTKLFSLLVLESPGFDNYVTLPFFLSLPPPGTDKDLQLHLLTSSLQHLYGLFSNDALLASNLIRLLSASIRTGGGRWHETLLQNGTIHVLASALRQSLVRAEYLQVQDFKSYGDFVKAHATIGRTTTTSSGPSVKSKMKATMSIMPVSPSKIPESITGAVLELLSECCGPSSPYLEDMDPSLQIQRTSDIALTFLWGMAMDFDLWGRDLRAASLIMKAVADRYAGEHGGCITSGYILRSQVSVQYFLDSLKAKMHKLRPLKEESDGQYLRCICMSCADLLKAMLLSSLSNSRSITESEQDVAALVLALADSPLGSFCSRTILLALVGVLTWCDIWNDPTTSSMKRIPRNDDDHKCQVASRLARNLLTTPFQAAVVPILLSLTSTGSLSDTDSADIANTNSNSSPSQTFWKDNWRLCLIVSSWLSSVAGPDGVDAAQSLGSLMLESALAGSLTGAMDEGEKSLVENLFIPAPSMALTVASASHRDAFSYTDLLESRLAVMMPVLPSLVISILGPPMPHSKTGPPPMDSLYLLTDLISAMGGAFHRVFGGMTHTAGDKRGRGQRIADAKAFETAVAFVPYLLEASLVMEHHRHLAGLEGTTGEMNESKPIKILRPPAVSQSGLSDGSWVEVSSTIRESRLSDGSVNLPADQADGLHSNQFFLFVLNACQQSIMTTISELTTNGMRCGGEDTTMLLTSILATMTKLDEHIKPNDEEKSKGMKTISLNFLCRLVAMLLINCLDRDYQWELWTKEQGAGVSRLCLLIEEREILARPLGTDQIYSNDQVLLICALLEVLSYGRDTAGWCQLVLPSPPQRASVFSAIEDKPGASIERTEKPSTESSNSSAAILLPVLSSSLRTVMECMTQVTTDLCILVPSEAPSSPTDQEQGADDSKVVVSEGTSMMLLIDRMASELRPSLMAAIVGLSFASARDVALHAMATIRRAITFHTGRSDEKCVESCNSLLCMVAEELRVRYDGERRLRGTALFDAYQDDSGEGRNTTASAAADSQAVENLILGGNLVPRASIGSKGSTEEVSFVHESDTNPRSDDFVVFTESLGQESAPNALGGARMDWTRYEGLGSALQSLSKSTVEDSSSTNEATNPEMTARAESVLSSLSMFLDAWDENSAVDAADTEIVKLFDQSGANDSVGDVSSQMTTYGTAGSETAADSMTTFIEISSAEKTRFMEVAAVFLPTSRYSREAFCQRFCWARYMESSIVDSSLWERGVADGNRDVRSRLVTMPCAPMFKQYIPKYLDNTANDEDLIVPAKASKTQSTSEVVLDMDEFTQTLIQTGHLEIVDITKKEAQEVDEDIADEMQNLQTSIDDDFDEAPLEVPTSESDTGKGGDSRRDEISSATKTEETTTVGTDGNMEEEETEEFDMSKVGSIISNVTASSFASPPDNSCTTLGLMESAAAGLIEKHITGCLHVKPEGSRTCSMLLTSTHLILEYDADSHGHYEGELMAAREEAERLRMIEESGGASDRNPEDVEKRQREAANLRPRSIRWNLSELSHVYLRRYRNRDSAVELFFIPSGGTSFGGYGLFSPSTSLFLDFGPGYDGNTRRDDAAFAIMKRAPPQAIKQWPDRSAQFLHEQLSRLTMGWVENRVSNFDYLLHLNVLAGRSYNDLCQYPVMPWVLSNYKSQDVPDLTDPTNFRDLTKPIGALNPSRLAEFIERFNTFSDPSIPPFMYGSHYSTQAGVVLHFLVRLHPYAQLHRQLQGGHFDVADRLFSSVPRTWDMCTGSSAAEVKELTPEWYCNPAFLTNKNNFKLGTSQDGDIIKDVVLPPWAEGSPEKFIEVMRSALESDICSAMLPDWIDLIFGRKQQGPEAIAANNVFFYLTYYGSINVSAIEDESLRQATELQIAHFGQCPMQLFVRPHVRRIQHVNKRRLSFYQIISAYSHGANTGDGKEGEDVVGRTKHTFGHPLYLPFYSAPLSHWVHVAAPYPRPHADLISIRLAGTDRALAVDRKGIFHCFRWVWKAEDPTKGGSSATNTSSFPIDDGCFIAQRELPRFRLLPRLVHVPAQERHDEFPAVAISKTLFAGRSVLLVLSDGDGRGGLAMQLVDPAKGTVRGEAVINSVHTSRISVIATDPIGTAAGHGGVGGELAIVGSCDSSASIWRFMSSHYLPQRPRVRLSGHDGAPIHAVGISSAINIAATVSSKRLCLHTIGNGNVIRIIEPPTNTLDIPADMVSTTTFARSPAIAISVQGYVVVLCETQLNPQGDQPGRSVISLHMFSLEGVSIGSKALESWRGIPHKIVATPDGTAILVCSGRGVTVHRLSSITPLLHLDEWHITESEELSAETAKAFDLDLGPSLNRPVVAAAACSDGVLRLHALPGISAFAKRHQKVGISQTLGGAASRIKNVFGKASNMASKKIETTSVVEISKEIRNDVKERGVTGFLGMFGKKMSS